MYKMHFLEVTAAAGDIDAHRKQIIEIEAAGGILKKKIKNKMKEEKNICKYSNNNCIEDREEN